jgi:hypothetical protein
MRTPPIPMPRKRRERGAALSAGPLCGAAAATPATVPRGAGRLLPMGVGGATEAGARSACRREGEGRRGDRSGGSRDAPGR